jgi:hypothetical protein
MLCNQCEKPFDTERHIPKLLPKCGHSVCALCLAKLTSTSFPEFKCPFDNIQYVKVADFSDNLYILEQLNRAKPSAGGRCSKHSKDLEIFCNNCLEVICSDCALFDGHKMHSFEPLSSAQNKAADKLRKYKSQISELQNALSSETKDLGENIKLTCKEKVEHIDRNFRELAVALEELRRKTVDSITGFYSNVQNSFALFKNKLEELKLKIHSVKSEKELLTNPNFEKEFLRDMREIDELISSKNILAEIEQHRNLIDVSFDRSFFKNLPSFCKIECHASLNDTKRNSMVNESKAFYEQINNNENLLHESFKDLIKNAAISLLHDDNQNIEESRRTKTFFHHNASPKPMNNYINELKNYSPLSGYSGVSAQKKNNLEERSMLSRKKETKSVLSYGTINPFTTKKSMNSINENEPKHRQSDATSIKSSMSNNKTDAYANKENIREVTSNINPKDKPATKQERIQQLFDLACEGKLETLDLSNFGLEDRLIEFYANKFAALKGVLTLKLDNNLITEAGLKVILKNIKSNKIKYIFMTDNKLADTAIDYFLSFRKYNSALKAVYIAKNPINCASRKVQGKIKMLVDQDVTVII